MEKWGQPALKAPWLLLASYDPKVPPLSAPNKSPAPSMNGCGAGQGSRERTLAPVGTQSSCGMVPTHGALMFQGHRRPRPTRPPQRPSRSTSCSFTGRAPREVEVDKAHTWGSVTSTG